MSWSKKVRMHRLFRQGKCLDVAKQVVKGLMAMIHHGKTGDEAWDIYRRASDGAAE